jgi:hypothetical protein
MAEVNGDGGALSDQYSGWIQEALGAALEPETKATCSECAMCADWPPVEKFKPDVKCCSFIPSLPNFRVGAILADPDPALERGRETVRARLLGGDGANPLFLEPPRAYALAYPRLSRDGFGGDRSLVCPHFSEGRCSIWRWREAVCSTYFCRYVRGGNGRAVWRHARRLLVIAEAAVARACVLQAGLEVEALHGLLAIEDARGGGMGANASPEAIERSWGRWRGREEEFYLRCWEAARPLTWADVLRLGGSEADVQARALWHRFHEGLPKAVPPRLKAASYSIVGSRQDSVAVVGYSRADPLELSRAAASALTRFDGRPTEAILDEVQRRDGVIFAPSQLIEPMDYGILVAA